MADFNKILTPGDYENGEINRYKNAIVLFNSVYSAFADHYNRTHLPLSHGSFRG